MDGTTNNTNKKPKIVATYDYAAADGKLLYQVVQYANKKVRRRPLGEGGWKWSTKGSKEVPYCLPQLLAPTATKTVFIVEEEDDVERLRSLGLTATCNAGGAGKWTRQHSDYLIGRTVVILPDNDKAGRKHGEQVARSLVDKAAGIKVLKLPDLPDKGNVSDWLDAGGSGIKLLDLLDVCPSWAPSPEVRRTKKTRKAGSAADKLIGLAEVCELFSDETGEAYARFPVEVDGSQHNEVSRLSAKSFRRWLKRLYYEKYGKAVPSQALQDALGVIEAKAIYDGEQHRVFVRIAEYEKKIYVDLASKDWDVVEIDQAGYRLVENPPVKFRRAKAMLALPTPASTGDLGILRQFANVSDDDWPLVLAWLVAAVRPGGPYPVLAVHGEHGSAKSTLCRFLRQLVDPNAAPLRSDYREPRDLMICANNGWIIALDNVSTIPAWLSDCLCRLATGGGFSTRTLYENDEETIFDAKRPVILNCIEPVVTRSDLLDRCVLLNLPRIQTDRRKSERQLDLAFNAAVPGILGGLLTAISVALRNESTVTLPALPRMADFAIWATAAESEFGLQPGAFMEAYTVNRTAGNESAIEASPVGKAVIDFVAVELAWEGTATELLEELESRADERTLRSKYWPGGANILSGTLQRLAPNLRDVGVGIEFSRTKRRKTIALRTDIDSSVTNVTSDTTTEELVEDGDDMVTQLGGGVASDLFNDTTENPFNIEESGAGDVGDAGDPKTPSRSLAPASDSEWVSV